jgi:hypothetical protein
MNIRVYKVIYPGGLTVFESLDDNGRDGYGNIHEIALLVRSGVVRHFKAAGPVEQVTIDFSPFHDIEHCSGPTPRLCVALSEKEKQEFWKYYNRS